MPAALLKRGRSLLHQQCWLWGHDIRRERGNLLLAHGFERLRPPERVHGSSQYTLSLSGGSFVRLWGFGFYFGSISGIYLNRYEFIPRATTLTDLWQVQQVARLRRACDFTLLPEALRWIGSYEAWVLNQYGTEYRNSCLCGWDGTVSATGHIADDWIELADSIERNLFLQACRNSPEGPRSLSAAERRNPATGSRHSFRIRKTRGQLRENPAAPSV